jgi:hypothetical protein
VAPREAGAPEWRIPLNQAYLSTDGKTVGSLEFERRADAVATETRGGLVLDHCHRIPAVAVDSAGFAYLTNWMVGSPWMPEVSSTSWNKGRRRIPDYRFTHYIST